MKGRLVSAARALFVEKGFAETGTPEIVKRADVTRGALYHHFTDKAALFDAVLVQEAAELAQAIDSRAKTASPEDALIEGSRAFFEAMSVPGRANLLIVEGPAVLGQARMDDIDAGGGRATLKAGLDTALPGISDAERDALATVLSASFDRAALAVAGGASETVYLNAILRLMAVVTKGELL